MKQKNIRTLSFVVSTLTYLIIGAALFDHFESPLELIQNNRLNKNISLFMQKHNMNETEFNRLWETILLKKPYEAGHQWKFVGSLYFCTLVVTLIGYGHSTPRTFYGKSFCILYTVVGIPIFLIMFQSVGERLNSFIVYMFSNLKKKLNFKKHDVSMVELIAVEFGLALTITIFASYIFVHNEGWTYFDALYYCFITLTTIGFGDMVPLQTDNALSDKYSYACFTILFILTGLTTLASSMNLLVLKIASITAEEQVKEKIEQDEARRQMAHIDGDVINFNTRLNSVSKEIPEQLDNISVCSCNCIEYESNYRCYRHKTCLCSSNKRNMSDAYTYNYKTSNELNQCESKPKKTVLKIFKNNAKVKRLSGETFSKPDQLEMNRIKVKT